MVTNLVPWSFRSSNAIDAFRREMDDLVGRLQDWNGGESAWFAPRANLAETENAYEIAVELPGLTPEDFDLELQDGNLTVRGTRKQESEEKGRTYHRIERKYGEFRRVFTLGRDVDAENVQAEYKAGVLHIVVPKSPEVRPKKIEIKS